jgi:hypothetical protein
MWEKDSTRKKGKRKGFGDDDDADHLASRGKRFKVRSLYHALSSLQQMYTMQKQNWVLWFQDYAPFFFKDMCSIPHHVVWCTISQDGRIGSQFSLLI